MASNLKTKKGIVLFLFLVSFFLVCTVSFAKPVTVETAMQVGANWMLQQTGIDHQIIECTSPSSRDDFQDGIIPYYIFNMDPAGWVIVSGDDIAYPIIGYSPQGMVDPGDMPPAFIEWMALIEKEIKEEINIDSEPLLSIETAWEKLDVTDYDASDYKVLDEAVSPLIKTTWSQGKYYNRSCPADSAGPDGHVYVGCVATAAGQIMKYHNWPTTGTGSHSYTHSKYGTLSANFGATTYNWGSMPASGQLTSYNTAVATMLYHVGVSVDMDYGTSGSGASSSDIPAALRTYFKYNADNFVNRSSYSTTSWLAKLKADHDAGRPVYYRSPGHAFICDGYSGTDYFHFNWGWNGSYDGYFYLDDLTPGSHNYNADQGANFGIYPAGGTTTGRAEIIGTWGNGIFYRNVATNTWTQMYAATPGGAIAAGDVTADGRADLVACWASGLWYQSGASLGWTKVWDGAPSKVACGDVTGDGRAEIIGTWGNGIFYRNVATSTWTQMYAAIPSGPIAAGDVTGDGKADLVACWTSGLWYQSGASLGWTKVWDGAPSKVACGDVTGDGRAEIIGTWGNGIFYRNVATSTWTQMYAAIPSGPIAAGDVTGDGKADLVACWTSGLWYQSGASLGWTKVWDGAPSKVACGNVTGDSAAAETDMLDGEANTTAPGPEVTADNAGELTSAAGGAVADMDGPTVPGVADADMMSKAAATPGPEVTADNAKN